MQSGSSWFRARNWWALDQANDGQKHCQDVSWEENTHRSKKLEESREKTPTEARGSVNINLEIEN
jgi:hypothetical protein